MDAQLPAAATSSSDTTSTAADNDKIKSILPPHDPISPTLRQRRTPRSPRHRSPHHPNLLLKNRRRQRPTFTHLLHPLHPLISIETGDPHPLFPRTNLAYHLLSHAQLDALAAHYHQLRPSCYSLGYPTTVVGRWGAKREGGEGKRVRGVMRKGAAEGEQGEEVGMVMQRDQHFEALMMEAKGALRAVEGGARAGEEVVAMEDVEMEEEEEYVREGKRRKFGRFIGMKGCDSPGMDDEGVMSEAIEVWVEGRMAEKLAKAKQSEELRAKGIW